MLGKVSTNTTSLITCSVCNEMYEGFPSVISNHMKSFDSF